MSFADSFNSVILLEGGYSNHPSDSGGKTCYGITEGVARANGYHGSMRDLPIETASKIYYTQFWTPLHLDEISVSSSSLADRLFDMAVNVGLHRAGGWLQRSLNALNSKGSLYADMVVDGIVGPITLTALRAYLTRRGTEGETVLLKALNGLQAAYYIELAERREKDESFLYGWLRKRIKS